MVGQWLAISVWAFGGNKMVMAAKTVTDSDRLCGTLVALLIVMLP